MSLLCEYYFIHSITSDYGINYQWIWSMWYKEYINTFNIVLTKLWQERQWLIYFKSPAPIALHITRIMSTMVQGKCFFFFFWGENQYKKWKKKNNPKAKHYTNSLCVIHWKWWKYSEFHCNISRNKKTNRVDKEGQRQIQTEDSNVWKDKNQ